MRETGLLYHRTAGLYGRGDRIHGGNWGRIILGVGPSHPAFYREYLLERIRQAGFPDKPSRMQAVFAFATFGFARDWTRPQAVPEYVYAVRLTEPDGPQHRGDMSWVDMLPQFRSFEAVDRCVRRYWSGDDRDPQQIEIVASCDLIVEDRLTPIAENGYH